MLIHSFSRTGAILIAFVLSVVITACDNLSDDSTVSFSGTDITMPLPVQLAGVPDPSQYSIVLTLTDVQTNEKQSFPLSFTQDNTSTGGGSIVYKGTLKTEFLKQDKFYKISVLFNYPYNGKTLKIVDTDPLNKSFQLTDTDANGLPTGNFTFTDQDFADRIIYPDSDLDGYTNLQEIDASLGIAATDPFNSYSFSNAPVINAPKNQAIIVCPKLDEPTLALLEKPTNQGGHDWTDRITSHAPWDCSYDGSNDFIYLHSGATINPYQFLMDFDNDFAGTLNMVHGGTEIQTYNVDGYTSRFIHPGVGADGLGYFNVLQYPCSSVVASITDCTGIPSAKTYYESATYDGEHTAHLPFFLRLDSNVNEIEGTNEIKVSWNRLVGNIDDGTNYDITYYVYRSTNRAELNAPTDANLLTYGFNTIFEHSLKDGQNILTYHDNNIKGGVLYYYMIGVVVRMSGQSNTLLNLYTVPAGMSTTAGIGNIYQVGFTPGNPSSFFGDLDIVEDGVSLTHTAKLKQPVAYDTKLHIYYRMGVVNNLTADKIQRDMWKSACDNDTANCTHKILDGTSNYSIDLTFTQPTWVLFEKYDRIGRFAGFQVREIGHAQ